MPGRSSGTPIPTEQLAAPARRALTGAGYSALEQLAETNEAAVEELHSIVPTALETLRDALEAHGTSYAEGTESEE